MNNILKLGQSMIPTVRTGFIPTESVSYGTLLQIEQALNTETKQTGQLKTLQKVLQLAPGPDHNYLKDLDKSTNDREVILSVQHFNALEKAIGHSKGSSEEAKNKALQVFLANKNKSSHL